MRYFLLSAFIFTLIFAGCTNPGEPAANSGANKSANSVNTAAANSNNPLGTTKRPETATTNNAPTLAPVIEGFYNALQKKDESEVKKYLSAGALKYYQDEAKAENKTWLAYLSEYEEPLDEKREVRNEKVEGNTAIAEMKGGSLGVWTKFKFVQENGEWKFVSPAENLKLEDIGKSPVNPSAS